MKLKLHWQILIALILALAIAVPVIATENQKAEGVLLFLKVCSFIGQMFLRLLKMIVVPLIACSIIQGMIGLGSDKNFGRMGIKTLAYYMSTGFVAICVGLIMVNILQPGGKLDPDKAAELLGDDQVMHAGIKIADKTEGASGGDFAEIFIRMIPSNVFDYATSNGNLLGVIFFCLFFGYFVSRLPEKHLKFQVALWDSLLQVMTTMADFIIKFAPIGVFALVAPELIKFGFDLLMPIITFFITVISALAFHMLVVLSLYLKFIAKVNPIDHLRGMSAALLTAFSTASSVSTLPVTMECARDNAKVSKRVTSFTLPLGATVNMDGTALYECVVVIFIAQFYAVVDPSYAMTMSTQFTIVLMALLTSVGVAGIPSASLVAITIILGVVGLPLEYLGIIFVVDRLLDMCRTAVNIYSDSVGAVVIAKLEGESGFYNKPSV